jgi:hypothetical protein
LAEHDGSKRARIIGCRERHEAAHAQRRRPRRRFARRVDLPGGAVRHVRLVRQAEVSLIGVMEPEMIGVLEPVLEG